MTRSWASPAGLPAGACAAREIDVKGPAANALRITCCLWVALLTGCGTEHETLRKVLGIADDEELTVALIEERAIQRFPIGTSLDEIRAALPATETTPPTALFGPLPFEPWTVSEGDCRVGVVSEFAASLAPDLIFTRRFVSIQFHGCDGVLEQVCVYFFGYGL